MFRCKRKIYSQPIDCCRNSSGFTIVEVVVAIAVLSTSMLAVFGTLRICASANNTSQRLTESMLLAEKLLAEISLDDRIIYRTIKGDEGLFHWQVKTVPTGLDNLAAISVMVEWLDQQKTKKYQCYSLIHIPASIEGK